MKLTTNNIALNEEFATKQEAIDFVGQKLVDCGYASVEYIEGMHDRDRQVSVYMGNDLAIPHGSDDYRKYIKKTGMVVVQAPNGVDFDGNEAKLLVGLAANGDDHMEILSNIAIICSEQEMVDKLVSLNNAEEIIEIIERGA